MADPVDLTQQLIEAATSPALVTSDGMTVQSRPAADIIALDQYLAAKAVLSGGRSGWNCLRPARVVPPGTIGPKQTEG